MTRIQRFVAAVAGATVSPWRGVNVVRPGDEAIGGFEADRDTEFALAARDIAEGLVKLHSVAHAINARAILGLTYIRAAERKALREVDSRLDAVSV